MVVVVAVAASAQMQDGACKGKRNRLNCSGADFLSREIM